MRVHAECEYSAGFLRPKCGGVAVSECVYCARAFCERHGVRGPDFTDACARRACQRKFEDLAAHLEWKRRVEPRNRTSICADEGCQERIRHSCARCRLSFCQQHISETLIVNRNVQPARRERVLICRHCRDRRKIWDER